MQAERRSLSLRLLSVVLLTAPWFSATVATGGERTVSFRITVNAGRHHRKSTPVHAAVRLPADWARQAQVSLIGPDRANVSAQITAPALLDARPPGTSDKTDRVIWWVLPELKAGQSVVYQATVAPGPAEPGGTKTEGFTWRAKPGRYTDLLRGDQPVLRYMSQAYEFDNDPKKQDLNNKPFHHLFDPSGKRLVTKGSGGFYTHHQGLFYGFTRCRFDGKTANTWYCHDGEHELHKKTLSRTDGPVLARHRTEIDWNDRQGEPFFREIREVTVWAVNGGTLLEWSSRLRSLVEEVTLDGDSQHAGFQFRAANEVAERQKEKLTYYLRPDGKGRPGGTRNAGRGKGGEDPAHPDSKQVMNLPWKVMSFVLGQTRYSVEYIDSPRNPKSSFYSERAYGRFGSWFGKQTLKKNGPPIEISYRIWLQQGEMTREQAASLSTDFSDAPATQVALAQ